jgi:hypothetical protein
LAKANDAVFAKLTEQTPLKIETLAGLHEASYCCAVSGEQTVGKGREEAMNKVHVQILVVRLPSHGTDMLVTLNTPIFISEGSAAAKQAGSGYKEAHLSAPLLFQQIVSTLHIFDWGLFGES